MPIPLSDVITDPSLAAAEPIVLAGEAGLARLVRWVHTSEVFEIAELLSGGEFLLIGGVSLESATEQDRIQYVRALASRGIAGLAIETGRRLPVVPAEMIEEAERLGLPLIELTKVVRFVEVSQAINGTLVNESFRRLQLADRVSHALTSSLAAGGTLEEMLAVLSAETTSATSIMSLNGEVIATFGEPDLAGEGVTAAIATAGVTVATLVMHPQPGTDPVLLDAARDRAPEAFALALLQSRPLSKLERNSREFLTLAINGTRTPQRFEELADRLGIANAGPYVTVQARLDSQLTHIRELDAALRRNGRIVIGQVYEESYISVVALAGGPLKQKRTEVLKDLRQASLPRALRVVVGPGARSLSRIERCMHEATVCMNLVEEHEGKSILDAGEHAIERLLVAIAAPDLVAAYIDEQLGDLLELDERKVRALFETLATYLRHSGNKTETATALHLQRQSLYQRLEKIFELLGDVPPGSARLGGLMVAVELESARRRMGLGNGQSRARASR